MNIRAARTAANLTQEQLATIVGLSSTFLSRIESGRKPVPFWLMIIAGHLRRHPDRGAAMLRRKWPQNAAPRWFQVLTDVMLEDSVSERLVARYAGRRGTSDQKAAGKQCTADVL